MTDRRNKTGEQIATAQRPTYNVCMQQMENFQESEIIKIGPPEMPDGDLCFIREFFDPAQSDDFLRALLASDQWRQDTIKRGRNENKLPRLTLWYGNSGKNYSYSGIRMKPLAWNAPLLTIKQAVDAEAGVKFNRWGLIPRSLLRYNGWYEPLYP